MFPDVGAVSQDVTTEIDQDAGVTLAPLGDTAQLKDEGIAHRGPAHRFTFGTRTYSTLGVGI